MNQLDIDHAKAIDRSIGAYEIDSVSVTRVADAPGWPNDPSRWSLAGGQINHDAGLGEIIFLPFTPPHGAVITAVETRILPAGAHGGLPGTMPAIQLYRFDFTGAGGTPVTSLGTQSDTSGSVGAYEVAHAITISGLSHTVDLTTNRYVLELSMESGANALVGTRVRGVSYTCTVTKLDVG